MNFDPELFFFFSPSLRLMSDRERRPRPHQPRTTQDRASTGPHGNTPRLICVRRHGCLSSLCLICHLLPNFSPRLHRLSFSRVFFCLFLKPPHVTASLTLALSVVCTSLSKLMMMITTAIKQPPKTKTPGKVEAGRRELCYF